MWSIAMNLTLVSSVDLKLKGEAASRHAPTVDGAHRFMSIGTAIRGNNIYGGCEDGSMYKAAFTGR